MPREDIPEIYSDNGTNFLRASRELSEVQSLLHSKDTINSISHLSSSKGITWNFIPAMTPHMGGLWEAAIRALKLRLKKVVGTHVLTYQQLATVIAKVEAILTQHITLLFRKAWRSSYLQSLQAKL